MYQMEILHITFAFLLTVWKPLIFLVRVTSVNEKWQQLPIAWQEAEHKVWFLLSSSWIHCKLKKRVTYTEVIFIEMTWRFFYQFESIERCGRGFYVSTLHCIFIHYEFWPYLKLQLEQQIKSVLITVYYWCILFLEAFIYILLMVPH